MSAQENKDTIRRIFEEAFNQGKLELIDENYLPEYEFDAPNPSGPSLNSGRENFKQRVGAFGKAFADVHYNVQDIVAEDDLVVTRFAFGGFHQGPFQGFSPTGRWTTVNGIHCARFVDGKVKKTWAGFTNIAEALSA